jgi:hypothetical protein
MFYNEDFGCETIDKEYKLFTLNPIHVSTEDSLELLQNGKWCFNKSVIESIKNYIQMFLPKYISSYTHPLSKVSQGSLYIGIQDDGIIYGIPYKGILQQKFIEKEIDKTFQTSLKFECCRIKNMYRKGIKVEIIEIDKTMITTTDLSKNIVFNEYLYQINKIQELHDNYIKKKRIWEKIYDAPVLKLHEIINKSENRYYIIKYLQEKTLGIPNCFKNKYASVEAYCDIPNFKDTMVNLKLGYKYNPLTQEEIQQLKLNKSSIFYWTTMWKDSKNLMLRHIKPKPPSKNIDTNYPSFLLSQVPKMIPLWIKNNSKLNLFVIKISICGNIEKKCIKYKCGNKWLKCYRAYRKGCPISLPYY